MSPDPDEAVQEPTLHEFLASSKRNAYVRHPGFSRLYVRSTRRFGAEVIDLANLEAEIPGNGAFTALVAHIRTTYPDLGIYVECVLTERFGEGLLALGFSPCHVGLSFCYYLAPEGPLR